MALGNTSILPGRREPCCGRMAADFGMCILATLLFALAKMSHIVIYSHGVFGFSPECCHTGGFSSEDCKRLKQMQYIKSSNDNQAEPARNSTYAQRDGVTGWNEWPVVLVSLL